MKTLSVALALALVVPCAAHAQGQKGGPHGNNVRNDVNVNVDIVFGDRDRMIIADYYGGRGGAGSMPPGHARQLQEKGRLPPGIAKKQLPRDLIGRLPPLPPGYDRVIIGSDVVLVQVSTNTIMDIIRGVVR